jgi:hypothetical protein
MTRSVRPSAFAVTLAALFFAATSQWLAAQPNSAQNLPPSGQSAPAQTTPANSYGDLRLYQTTNSDGSITSNWTTANGTSVADDKFKDNGDGTTTWTSDHYLADGKTKYSITTFTTKADGSSVSTTVYPGKRTLVINADATGKITEMKETPPPVKPQAGGPQASESEQVAATPAPVTEPPTTVYVQPVTGLDYNYGAIKITFPPKANGSTEESTPTNPESSANTDQYLPIYGRTQVFIITLPPGLKVTDPGFVVSGPSSGSAANSAVTPNVAKLRFRACIQQVPNTVSCYAPVGPITTGKASLITADEAGGTADQAIIYLPTIALSNQINGLKFGLSGALINTTGESQLNFIITGSTPGLVSVPRASGSVSAAGSPYISVVVSPGSNGPQINLAQSTEPDALIHNGETNWALYEKVEELDNALWMGWLNKLDPENSSAVPNPTEPANSASATGPTTTSSVTPHEKNPVSMSGFTPTFQLRGFSGPSFINGNTPATAGFDGAVLFPLGNRIMIGPTGGFQWVNSSIVQTIGSQQPGSTFINTSAGFKNGNFGGRIAIPFQFTHPTGALVDAFSIDAGAIIANSTITQQSGFCGLGNATSPAGCTVTSTTSSSNTGVGAFVGGHISHSIFPHVGVFAGFTHYFLPTIPSPSGPALPSINVQSNSIDFGFEIVFPHTPYQPNAAFTTD